MDDACVRLGVHRLPPPYGDEPTEDAAVGRMFDRWLVLGRLGEGAMGAVYLAEQQPVGLEGALKLITRGGGLVAEDSRFLREASALKRLTHPNIVRLLAYGVGHDQPYLVMEYIDGGRTLREVMPELDRVERRRILVQITHALEAAHTQGVVHRDLKPDNVMIQPVAGEPRFVRLVDFGLAKFTDEGDRTTIAAGSPRYMAPEQATQRDIGPWTDVYALGVMACEMLADHRPFGGGSVQAILVRKLDPAHDPLGDASSPVSVDLAGFLRQAMAADPHGRFPDAVAMRSALPPVDAFDDGLAATAPLADALPDGPTATAAAAAASTAGPRWPIWAAAGALAVGGVMAVTLVGAEPDTGAGGGARPPAAADADRPPPDAAPHAAIQPDTAQPDARPDAARDAARDATPDRAPAAPRTVDAPRPRRATPPKHTPTRPPKPADTRPSPGASTGFQMDPRWLEDKDP